MVDLSLRGSEESIRSAVTAVTAICGDRGFPVERGWEVATAVAEALSNAVRHGNREDPDLLIRLRVRTEPDDLVVEVEDRGQGLTTVPPLPDLARKVAGQDDPNGWGIYLMRSLASEVTFLSQAPGHHMVRMRFALTAPPMPVQPRIVVTQSSAE